jgi:HipA-like protein
MKFRKAKVLMDGESAGFLRETSEGFLFGYEDGYFHDPAKPPISLTLPKNIQAHRSKVLFAFFYGLLAEGENRTLQCRTLRLDAMDHFSRLLKTAHTETIGAITVVEEHGDG